MLLAIITNLPPFFFFFDALLSMGMVLNEYKQQQAATSRSWCSLHACEHDGKRQQGAATIRFYRLQLRAKLKIVKAIQIVKDLLTYLQKNTVKSTNITPRKLLYQARFLIFEQHLKTSSLRNVLQGASQHLAFQH